VVYVCDDDGYEFANPCISRRKSGMETMWMHACPICVREDDGEGGATI